MADSEGKAEEVVEIGEAEQEATSEEPSSQGDDQQNPSEIVSKLMRDPMVLAAMQHKLGSMVGGSSGYIQSLPKVVKRRIKALKKIQFEATKIEAEFYREVHRLECEYATKYAPLFEKRATMVTGAYEPNDEEADWPSDDEKDELAVSTDETEEVQNKVSIEEKTEENADKTNEKDEDTKGIPGFWLTIFKNVEMLADMIQTHDEPILGHLQDIKVEFKEKDPMGFTLEFVFETNDFFENKKLTKEYIMRSEPDEAEPFTFEGPEIVKCQGCKIDWKKGKNVTVKTVKKKQKHKASGTTRTISKTVQSDSFFNFFNPPIPPEDEEMDEDTETLLATDFEIGHFIRERIVPRAVLYFTGEALENDDEFEDGEEEEGGEEGEYDEDADPDYNPGRVKIVTPSFHARVAQLALGCVSKPSSAPPDTRLASRPSTAASVRQHALIQTDLPNRPDTAPVGAEGFNTQQIWDGPPKPNTKAFQEIQTESVIPQYTEKVKGSSPDVKGKMTNSKEEGKARPSPSKTESRPKSANLCNKTVAVDHAGKSVNADGVLYKDKTQEPLTNALEPEIPSKDLKNEALKINRESTFFERGQPGVGISREKTFITSNRVSGKGKEKLKNPQLQTLVEVSTSDVDQNCDENQADRKGKTLPVPAASGDTKPNSGGPGTTSGKLDGKEYNVKKVSASKVPVKETGKTVKDEARSILQRLTGKQSQAFHKAGQVPNVGRPVRKYTFAKPMEKPEEVQDRPESRKPVSAPPGHSRPQNVPATRSGIQARRDGYKPPSAAAKSRVSEVDSRSLGIKPASAPAQKKYQNTGNVKPSGNQDGQVKAKLLQSTQAVNKSHKKFPDPKSLIEAGQVVEQVASSKSASNLQRKGVRIQNAMINSSLDASGLSGVQEGWEEEEEEWVDEDLGGLHPKLRDSPYLKNNPLLMSKKARRKPSAGLSASGKQKDDPV